MSEVQFAMIDSATLKRIVARAAAIAIRPGSPFGRTQQFSLEMDLAAAHGVNGNQPLDLDLLLATDDVNFAHDVFGISRHINRETGKIEDNFRPRCTMKEPGRA